MSSKLVVAIPHLTDKMVWLVASIINCTFAATTRICRRAICHPWIQIWIKIDISSLLDVYSCKISLRWVSHSAGILPVSEWWEVNFTSHAWDVWTNKFSSEILSAVVSRTISRRTVLNALDKSTVTDTLSSGKCSIASGGLNCWLGSIRHSPTWTERRLLLHFQLRAYDVLGSY